MAILRTFFPSRAIVDFRLKCEQWLRNAEKQRVRATDMAQDASEMSRRAKEMAKPPISRLRERNGTSLRVRRVKGL